MCTIVVSGASNDQRDVTISPNLHPTTIRTSASFTKSLPIREKRPTIPSAIGWSSAIDPFPLMLVATGAPIVVARRSSGS